jgi:ABC-2 type transport system ATP-binding protein
LETILSVKNLCKHYGKIQALNKLSFSIKKGGIYGLLGPNGSGKSTALGIVLNVVNKTAGHFEWFDGTVSPHKALNKVGAIIERPNFYPYLTAAQNLALVCKIKGSSPEKIAEKLAMVDLYERKDSKFRTFSLGMKQRLAIASALLNDPDILILDEPTNGLDPKGIHQIRRIIKEVAAQGTTILLASHLLDEVEKVCSQVVVIKEGVKLYEGRVDTMTATEGFIELRTNLAPEKAQALLLRFDGISKTTLKGDTITAILQKPVCNAALNQYLFAQGVVLTHLVKRTPSLEEQFLALTNKA